MNDILFISERVSHQRLIVRSLYQLDQFAIIFLSPTLHSLHTLLALKRYSGYAENDVGSQPKYQL